MGHCIAKTSTWGPLPHQNTKLSVSDGSHMTDNWLIIQSKPTHHKIQAFPRLQDQHRGTLAAESSPACETYPNLPKGAYDHESLRSPVQMRQNVSRLSSCSKFDPMQYPCRQKEKICSITCVDYSELISPIGMLYEGGTCGTLSPES